MFSSTGRVFLLSLGLILLIVGPAVSKPRKAQRLPTGPWGGPHIRIDVGARSASIEYDCASGTINGPLTVDSRGRFTWRGTHHREHAGPIRVGEQGNDRPATYSGFVRGDKMTLTVKLPETNEVLETYTLKRGGFGRVFKCK
jgi:hypothetical protein